MQDESLTEKKQQMDEARRHSRDNCGRHIMDPSRRPPIQTIGERIIELLHYCDTDPIFEKFCADLKLLNSPIHELKNDDGTLVQYLLSELGVSIWSNDTAFYSAHFHIQPTSDEGIVALPYCNELPFRLQTQFTRSEVHDLLGAPHRVSRPSGLWAERYHDSESYELEPWYVIFWYLKPSAKLREPIVHKRASTLRSTH